MSWLPHYSPYISPSTKNYENFPLPLAAVKELILEHGGVSKRVSENQQFWILKHNDFCVDTNPIEKGSVNETFLLSKKYEPYSR